MRILRKIKKAINLLFSLQGIKKLWHYFYFYKQYKVPGQLQIEEGELLYRFAKMNDVKTVVEVGSYKGKSTNFILRGLSSEGRVHCIDTWENQAMTEGLLDTYNIFRNNIPKDQMPRVTMHRGFSTEVRKTWDISIVIDMLFIDGDHSYDAVKKDIEDWMPLVKKGGYVIFHDYANCPDVQKAIQPFLDNKQLVFLEEQQNIFATQKQA